MSEFLAEARVLILPDTKGFRAALEAQLKAIHVAPISIPIVASGAGLAAAAAATASLTAAQKVATESGLGLASTETVVNRAVAQGIPILQARAVATEELAGSQAVLDAANRKSAASLLGAGTAAGKLDAALLGLRTAVGSSAVIGLSAIALGAIAAGKAIRGMILATAQFETELNTFRAITGATADDLAAVSREALQLGEDVRLPAVSAADAAVAMTELARAGLSVQEAMDGAEGVLQLATAAQISNAEAAKLAANALNSFGLAGAEAAHVADLFANAANAAQGSVLDIGIAFQQASAVARQVGLSLENTTAILSLFAKNGLQGSDAGTSLRVALIRLVAPTKEAAAEIKKLGLNIRDAAGNVRADIFAQFGEATRGLAPAARDAAAALIFGQDAIRAVSIGAREGREGLRLMQFEVDQTGTAAEVAAARTQGFAGAVEGLNSQLTTLGITFGGPINRVLTAFARGASESVENINRLTVAIGDFLDAAANLPVTPQGGAGKFFADLSANARDAIGPIERLRDSFRGTIDGISEDGLDASQRLRVLNKELTALEDARIAVSQPGQAQPAIADQLTKQIKELREEIKRLKAEGDGINQSVTNPLKAAFDQLERARTARVQLGLDPGPINDLIDSLTRAAQEAGRATQRVNDLPDGITRVGDASTKAAQGVDALTRSLKALGRQAAQSQAELLRLQTEGGSPQQQVAVLQADIQTQRDIIAQQKRRGGAPGSATAIKTAREQILRDQSQIESIQSQIESDAKAAAASAKDSARRAQDARDEQFQAIAESFGGRQEDIENAIERAGIRDNIARQIRLNKALIASLLKERKVLLDRLKNLKVSAEVRKRILEAINDALEEARQDQIRLQQEQQENINRAINTRLDLRIQLAEARDDVAAQIKARRAKLAQITKELVKLKNAGKKNTIAWLELKVQQAEEIAAIKELEKKTKEKNNAGKSMFFEFLQTQQGFAANLLGNLIPGFATRGLVGGSGAGGGASGPTGGGGGGVIGTFGDFGQPGGPQPGGGVIPGMAVSGAAAVASARERGVRPIQVDTTNQLLRRILRVLQNTNGRLGHPEARYQRSNSDGAMDTLPV